MIMENCKTYKKANYYMKKNDPILTKLKVNIDNFIKENLPEDISTSIGYVIQYANNRNKQSILGLRIFVNQDLDPEEEDIFKKYNHTIFLPFENGEYDNTSFQGKKFIDAGISLESAKILANEIANISKAKFGIVHLNIIV
jgi:hypothetical protein